MKHFLSLLAFVARCVVLGLASAFIIGLIWPGSGQLLRQRFDVSPSSKPLRNTSATPPIGPPALASYADAVAKAAPYVVNIYANKLVTEQALQMYTNPLLQQLFGGQPSPYTYKRREQNLGSGVIVSPQGYVLTNNHVIAHADDIWVLLSDRRIAKATVVGTDQETDLAVLKINAGNLPYAHINRASPLRVGDVVLAIGNPFGLNQTVTMGIVSAIGRQLSRASDENFIQTDAAINPGNSGGALINSNGNLVGINTLLIGKTANAEGIGFAIPIGTAKEVLDQIIAHGYVIRGWLGARYGFVPIAANSGLPAAARGAQVTNLYTGGPAARAGIQQGDILLKIGGHYITDPNDLRRSEAMLKPGSTVELSGLHRNGVPFHMEMQVAQRPFFDTTTSDSDEN